MGTEYTRIDFPIVILEDIIISFFIPELTWNPRGGGKPDTTYHSSPDREIRGQTPAGIQTPSVMPVETGIQSSKRIACHVGNLIYTETTGRLELLISLNKNDQRTSHKERSK